VDVRADRLSPTQARFAGWLAPATPVFNPRVAKSDIDTTRSKRFITSS
jgi:hypothetical protein